MSEIRELLMQAADLMDSLQVYAAELEVENGELKVTLDKIRELRDEMQNAPSALARYCAAAISADLLGERQRP